MAEGAFRSNGHRVVLAGPEVAGPGCPETWGRIPRHETGKISEESQTLRGARSCSSVRRGSHHARAPGRPKGIFAFKCGG